MVVIFNALGKQIVLEQAGATEVLLRRDLPLPLEGREGLRHKKCRGDVNTDAALFVGGVRLPGLQNLEYQIRDAENVLVGLGGQAKHKVELDAVPAAGKGDLAGFQNVLLGHILIDRVAQALRAGLRREGQAGLSHRGELQHQIAGKVVRPKRWN